MGSPASALGFVTGPGDAGPSPDPKKSQGQDGIPSWSHHPAPTLTLRMLPPDFFTISSSTMDCKQMLSMMACKGQVSWGSLHPTAIPHPTRALPFPSQPPPDHHGGSSTCGLVMVTHCSRSLLIRYSKASSSFTSDFPGLLPEGPLLIGTCKDAHQGWEPPEGKQQLPRHPCRSRAAPSQVQDTRPGPTSLCHHQIPSNVLTPMIPQPQGMIQTHSSPMGPEASEPAPLPGRGTSPAQHSQVSPAPTAPSKRHSPRM